MPLCPGGTLIKYVWTEYPELGERIAEAAGVPFFGGGPEASATIIHETGKRSIVASIAAHGTGKNLQRFHRNLVVTPPSSGATWEQLLGRTHRQGQSSKVIEVEHYQHTSDYRTAMQKARRLAAFVARSDGVPQRLDETPMPPRGANPHRRSGWANLMQIEAVRVA